jgi:serine/threonine protein kinase
MVGTTVGHYRIVEKIGEGGMGEVFLADDTRLRRKVALKFLPEHLHQDETARKRFLREAESAAALEHPYICNIKELGETEEGRDFIVMEYVEGRTLRERLEEEGALPLEEALGIALEVVDALALAHEKGLVHRDLKPSNIMLSPQGHSKVMDFGLAKRILTEDGTEQDVTSSVTKEGSSPGTPAYMSPEQVRAEPLDQRSDLFSFGIVLYEMLTGVNPFRRPAWPETMAAILHEEPGSVADRVSDTSPYLQETLARLLEKDPGKRIQTPEELQARLKHLLAGREGVGLGSFFRSRSGKWTALAVLGIIVIGFISRWALPGDETPQSGLLVSSIAFLPFTNLSGDTAE